MIRVRMNKNDHTRIEMCCINWMILMNVMEHHEPPAPNKAPHIATQLSNWTYDFFCQQILQFWQRSIHATLTTCHEFPNYMHKNYFMLA